MTDPQTEPEFIPPATRCEVCHQPLTNPEVLHSDKGWYVGTQCNCGPRDVSSPYYPTEQQAQAVLNGWTGTDWTQTSSLPMPQANP